MKYQLESQQVQFLMRHIEEQHLKKLISDAYASNEVIVKGEYKTGRYTIILDKQEVGNLVDILNTLLIDIGTDNGDLNGYGYNIEELIDIFSKDIYE